jgi:serine/threonine protein phosphatase 1
MNWSIDSIGSAYRIPDGIVLYAVGDIHGQLQLLDRLLDKVDADARRQDADQCVLVFVGDYIDRGTDSAGVIERLVSGLPEDAECRFILGNHEAILLEFIEKPERLPLWLMNGADATLRSYGIEAPSSHDQLHDFVGCRDEFVSKLPQTHRAFLDGLELKVKFGDYLCVHAGIRPGVPLSEQSRQDLLWIRGEFLDSEEDFGFIVVHGHTPGPVPVVRRNRIGIDTGAWAFGCLTAVRLHGATREFLSVEA